MAGSAFDSDVLTGDLSTAIQLGGNAVESDAATGTLTAPSGELVVTPGYLVIADTRNTRSDLPVKDPREIITIGFDCSSMTVGPTNPVVSVSASPELDQFPIAI